MDATVRPRDRTVKISPLATSLRTLENCRFAAAAEIVFMTSKVGFITTFVKEQFPRSQLPQNKEPRTKNIS